MGDRTTCTLYIGGKLAAKDFADVVAAIRDASPEECGKFSIEDKLHEPEGRLGGFIFHEVNYGEIDSDLAEALISANLAFSWQWDAGAGYPAGLELRRINSPIIDDFWGTVDDEIVVRVADVVRARTCWRTSRQLAEMIAAQEYLANFPKLVVEG